MTTTALNTLEAHGVKPGDTIKLKGEVEYSAITQKQSPSAPGSQFEMAPRNYIVISHIEVASTTNEGFTDYFVGKTYEAKDGSGKRLRIMDPAGSKIKIHLFDKTVKQQYGFIPRGELAKGTKVEIAIRAFQGSPNEGSGIQGILVEDKNKLEYVGQGSNIEKLFDIEPDPEAPVDAERVDLNTDPFPTNNDDTNVDDYFGGNHDEPNTDEGFNTNESTDNPFASTASSNANPFA